jgi:RNA polymerase sigma factor (sigma-70 family)
MRKITDNDLLFLKYAKNKNDAAFSDFYKENAEWIDIILIKNIKNREDREDIAQEIWIKVQDRALEYDPEISAVRTWIYNTIAKFEILAYFRDGSRKQDKSADLGGVRIEGEEIAFLENLPADKINTFQDFDRYYLNYVLRKAINKLARQEHQNLMLMHYFGDLRYKDIALIMNENYNNIRVWNHRASNELSNIVDLMGIRI